MQQRIHFISGLPRAGSTLLAAILRQNPRFHATISSPVNSLFTALYEAMGVGNESAVFLDDEKKRRILKGLFGNYYANLQDKEVVFDTNRAWCGRLPILRRLFPDVKVVCCVRNMAWIMDSFERLYTRNAFDISRIYQNDERGNVYTRVEALANYNRLVGFAWASLKEAFYGEHASSLLLVDYELLARAPENTLKLIYQFLEEEQFEHDFNAVNYEEPEFDARLGAPGLHAVSGKIAFRPRQTILPPDLFERFDRLSFWRDQRGSAANVITLKPEPAAATKAHLS